MGTEAVLKAGREERTSCWRADRVFFAGLSLLILFTVLLGFARTYFLAGVFRAKLPSLIVHIHGAVFTAWIVLLVAQVSLVSMGRVRLHRQLGVLGMFLAPLMVIFGFATLAGAIRRGFMPPPVLQIITAADCLTLCIFAVMALWAFLARRNPAAHKRAILLATVAVLGPAVARWPLVLGTFAFLTILDVLPALLIIFDLWTRRSLHRVTVVGALLTIGWQVMWMPLARSAALNHAIVWLQARQ